MGWCKRWKLQVQTTKTKLVHFSNHPRRKLKTPLTITIDDQTVPLAKEAEYLGVTFDRALNFKTHMKEMKKKTSSRIGLLRYLGRNVEGDPTRSLNMMHKSLVRSITTYASTIFLNCRNYWTTAQVIQNQALRAVLRVPQYTSSNYIHQQLREPKLFDFCSQSTLHYLNNAIQQGNSRILHIIQETVNLKNIVDLPLPSRNFFIRQLIRSLAPRCSTPRHPPFLFSSLPLLFLSFFLFYLSLLCPGGRRLSSHELSEFIL